mmetsp:Transcript_45342/g.145392  ORF Transcript_45342/g.145392 Transcript_45342/m.145392 type:complete len:245 (+) Transcript_45342:563-1297(+)
MPRRRVGRRSRGAGVCLGQAAARRDSAAESGAPRTGTSETERQGAEAEAAPRASPRRRRPPARAAPRRRRPVARARGPPRRRPPRPGRSEAPLRLAPATAYRRGPARLLQGLPKADPNEVASSLPPGPPALQHLRGCHRRRAGGSPERPGNGPPGCQSAPEGSPSISSALPKVRVGRQCGSLTLLPASGVGERQHPGRARCRAARAPSAGPPPRAPRRRSMRRPHRGRRWPGLGARGPRAQRQK